MGSLARPGSDGPRRPAEPPVAGRTGSGRRVHLDKEEVIPSVLQTPPARRVTRRVTAAGVDA